MEFMKKKLLITGSTFPRWEGDSEPRFILDYAKVMTKYYEVHVLVPMAPGAKEEEEMEGVLVHRYHYFPIYKFETLCYPGAIVPRIKEKKTRIILVPFLLVALRKNLKKCSKEFDLVHSNWLIPQGIVQSTIKKTSYIVTGHGGDITSLNFWPFKQMKKRTLKNAKHIIVVSEALREYVESFYPNDKTSIISMGCDTRAFCPKNRINNYFGQNEKKVILFVGRLEEVKGLTYLIEAMKDINDAVLYIVGKGSLENELKEQANEMSDKIVFVGGKTHKELPQVYASADVFVAPSVTASDGGKEGFGLVVIEAMASGIPVVASKSGGIKEIVKDEENGLLCEEKDVLGLSKAINRVINDNNLREKIVSNGLVTAHSYSYDSIGEKYERIIEQYI